MGTIDKKMFKVLQTVRSDDAAYDKAESMRNEVGQAEAEGNYKRAFYLMKDIDTAMLKICSHQSQVITEFVKASFPSSEATPCS